MATNRILIVDDEELARKKIKRFLRTCAPDFSIHEAENGVRALQSIQEIAPNLVFLDIEMPGLSGLEVLQNIEHRPFKLIFQTAHAEFAVRAFEENACDYLLKPFDQERFQKALQRALARPENENLLGLENQLRSEKQYLERLSVKLGNKTRLLKVNEVEYFTSKDH